MASSRQPAAGGILRTAPAERGHAGAVAPRPRWGAAHGLDGHADASGRRRLGHTAAAREVPTHARLGGARGAEPRRLQLRVQHASTGAREVREAGRRRSGPPQEAACAADQGAASQRAPDQCEPGREQRHRSRRDGGRRVGRNGRDATPRRPQRPSGQGECGRGARAVRGRRALTQRVVAPPDHPPGECRAHRRPGNGAQASGGRRGCGGRRAGASAGWRRRRPAAAAVRAPRRHRGGARAADELGGRGVRHVGPRPVAGEPSAAAVAGGRAAALATPATTAAAPGRRAVAAAAAASP